MPPRLWPARAWEALRLSLIHILLSLNAGQVFDRERIYETVWGLDGEGNSDTVMEHIRKIRAKLAACTLHSYIDTVWGCGYRWNV